MRGAAPVAGGPAGGRGRARRAPATPAPSPEPPRAPLNPGCARPARVFLPRAQSMDADEADRLRNITLAEAERYITSTGRFSRAAARSSSSRPGGGSNGGGYGAGGAATGSDTDSGAATPTERGGGGGGGKPRSKHRDFLLDLDLWNDQVRARARACVCVSGVGGDETPHREPHQTDWFPKGPLRRRIQPLNPAARGAPPGPPDAALPTRTVRPPAPRPSRQTPQGFPVAVSVSVVACCKGVKRTHLVDARVDGGLLLELYSRDGVGTMISADFYEGIRPARMADVDGIHVRGGREGGVSGFRVSGRRFALGLAFRIQFCTLNVCLGSGCAA
jgi:hypothetical protein